MIKVKRSKEPREKISKIAKKSGYKIKDTSNMKGTHPKTEFKKGQVAWNKGKKLPPLSEKTKKRMSESHPKGKDHHNWKGGITPFLKRIRNSPKYKIWRIKVFTRDNWTCQNCRKRGCYIEAHHIKSISSYPELVYDVDNGVTLCFECHKLVDKYRNRFKKIYKKGNQL